MKGFSHHESCPNCGSKDNLARYADGSAWCFGCHYRERRNAQNWSPTAHAEDTLEREEHPSKPDDCGTSFSSTAVEWLGQFYLDIPTAIRHGVVYSPSRDQIVYQLGNVWQARNLRVGGALGNSGRVRSKNFTSGNVNECTHIYGADSTSGGLSGVNGQEDPSRTLVIVEDPVSAIRIASLRDSMPLLGSHLATRRLNAIAGLYRSVVLWLDSDKLKEARAIAERAQLIGITARVIYTDLDPKCYTLEELKGILNAG